MQVKGTLAGLVLAFSCHQTAAQSCNFSNTGIDFGNVNLTTGGFQSSTGLFTADCTGTPNQTIRICPNFNAGSGGVGSSGSPRYLLQGSAQLEFDLFQTNGVGKSWGSYTWGYSPRPPVLSIKLDGSGSGSISLAIFARLYNKQSATPTGTFISTFAGANTQIDYGYTPAFNCGPTLSSRVQSVPFTVRATNNSSCTVTSTDLSFGSQSSLDQPIAATNSISVICTAGTQYEIGLSNGSSGASNPSQRRMTNPSTAGTVAYNIFRNGGHNQQWGNTPGLDTIGAVGSGSTQTFTGYGLVPAQPTPPSQTYSDNLIVVVTY